MKKFLALTLSLLMILGCMTSMFITTVSAATTEEINWQTPATDSWVYIAKEN